MIAPAALNFLTAVESIGALNPFNINEAADDCIPLTKMLSLIAIGMPSINDFYSSAFKFAYLLFSILCYDSSASFRI